MRRLGREGCQTHATKVRNESGGLADEGSAATKATANSLHGAHADRKEVADTQSLVVNGATATVAGVHWGDWHEMAERAGVFHAETKTNKQIDELVGSTTCQTNDPWSVSAHFPNDVVQKFVKDRAQGRDQYGIALAV